MNTWPTDTGCGHDLLANPYCDACVRAKMRHFKTKRGAFKQQLKKLVGNRDGQQCVRGARCLFRNKDGVSYFEFMGRRVEYGDHATDDRAVPFSCVTNKNIRE